MLVRDIFQKYVSWNTGVTLFGHTADWGKKYQDALTRLGDAILAHNGLTRGGEQPKETAEIGPQAELIAKEIDAMFPS